MRNLLALSLLTAVALHAAEETVDVSIRDKLRARLRETIPPPAPPQPRSPAQTKDDAGATPILLERVLVTESKFIERVTAAIDQAEQERREQQFSPGNGGTIGTLAGMRVGSWWAPGEGWTFLRKHQAPTYRQVEASKERMNELWDLATMAKKQTPKPAQ